MAVYGVHPVSMQCSYGKYCLHGQEDGFARVDRCQSVDDCEHGLHHLCQAEFEGAHVDRIGERPGVTKRRFQCLMFEQGSWNDEYTAILGFQVPGIASV